MAGSGVGLSFGVRALTEMEIRCVKGMFRLKLISSEINSVFKGLNSVYTPKLWNDLPFDVAAINSVTVLKHKLINAQL